MRDFFVAQCRYKAQEEFNDSDLLHRQAVIIVCKFDQEDTNLS
jgi:hypothetical protein